MRKIIRERHPVRPSTRLRQTSIGRAPSPLSPRPSPLAPDLDWNKVMVGAVGLVAALVLGVIVSIWQAARAKSAERRAEAEARLARQAEETAREETRIAEAERLRAGEAAQAARQNLYAADMNLAYQARGENNLGLALELLNKHRPGPQEVDLRGWEWRYLWGLCQSDALYTLGQHSNYQGGVFSLAISPDNRFLATACAGGGQVGIWDVASRRLIETPEPNDALYSVAFSPDGQRIAAGIWEQGIKIWNSTTGQEVATLRGINDWVDPALPNASDWAAVTSLALLPPDGNTLISGTTYEARLWRASSWAEIEAAEAKDKAEARQP